MELVEKRAVSDQTLSEAIEIMFDRSFPAMAIGNALAGYQSDVWKVIHQFKTAEILDEAVKRGLSPARMKGSVNGNLVKDHPAYRAYLKQKEPHAER